MGNSSHFVGIIFVLCLAPAVIHAQSVDKIGNSTRHDAGRRTLTDSAGRAGAMLGRPTTTLSDSHAVRMAPYVYAAFPSAEGRPLTVVDYTFTPQGVVGSVGYIHMMDDRQIAPEAGLAASLGFSRPDYLVGAGLSYEFR